jgi:hypothetical protein
MTQPAKSTVSSDATLMDGAATAVSVPSAVRIALLCRIAIGGGCTVGEAQRDLAPLAAHKLTGLAWRTVCDAALRELITRNLVARSGQRLSISDAGLAEAKRLLGPLALPADWPALRDIRLVAIALDVASAPAARIKSLARPDGLRAIVLERQYALPVKAKASPASIRAALAVVALDRAFGNGVKDGLGAGAGLAPKTSRLLASQLAKRSRDLGTDGRLIAVLAAEAVGAQRTDADELRLAILRRWIGSSIEASAPMHAPPRMPIPVDALSRATVAIAEVAAPIAVKPRPAVATRPDLAGFASAVTKVARMHAKGWPGSRKAMIADVWTTLSAAFPQWGLSAEEFKTMLAEAHRVGELALATADLKDKGNLGQLQNSAIVYKNTVWHLIRVDD